MQNSPYRLRLPLPNSRHWMFGALGVVGLVSLAAGCPDPKGRLDDWFDRSEPLRKTPSAGECVGISDISGDYLLGIAATIDKSKPLRFKMTIAINVDAATIEASIQPYAVKPNNGATPEGTLVGEVFSATSNLDLSTAGFVLDFGSVSVPVEGNPILATLVSANLTLVGCTSTSESSCGLIEGEITVPTDIALEGSTWAIVPLGDGVDPTSITLVTACPE